MSDKDDGEPKVRSCQRAEPGTLLELASYEEIIAELRQRRPTAAIVGVAYPTTRPGWEHSGKIDVVLSVGGEPAVMDQICYMLAERAGYVMKLGGGWDLG